MTPIFSIPDNSLTDDELAALTTVIAEAQAQLVDASLAPSPLPCPASVPAFAPAAAAGNVTYF